MRLRGSSIALIVMAACALLLMTYSLQLHYDYNILSSQYAGLQKSYNALSLDYARLRNDYNVLSSRFSDLQASYERLSGQYSSLERSYNALSNEYSSLKTKYMNLESKYSQLASECIQLNDTITYMIHTMNSYGLAKEAMPRVLSSYAVSATSSAVYDAGVSKSDFWGSIQKIYEYIRPPNVDYAQDIEVPIWYVGETIRLDDRTYIYSVQYYNRWDYIQTPELTLKIKKGDCDDQAVLAYAMIKYYMRSVYGTDYALYMAYVAFSGGGAHMAVVMPVQGGNICIIDPAGHYLTSTWYGRITSRPALEELQRYSNHWASQGVGSIKYMELWSIGLDGSPSVVAKGTIEEVAWALS
jgi:hypothetical protein